MNEVTEFTEGEHPSILTKYIKMLVAQEIKAYLKLEFEKEAEAQPEVLRPTPMDMNQKIKEMSLSGHGVHYIQSHFYKEQGQDISENKIITLHEQIALDFAAWQDRNLDSIYAFIWVGTIPYPSRLNNEIEEQEFKFAIGINRWGFKQLLGIYKGNKSTATNLLFNSLKNRGVRDIVICTASQMEDKAPIKDCFPDAIFFPSIVPLIHNSTEDVHYSEITKTQASLKSLFKCDTYQEAQQELEQFETVWGQNYPNLCFKWKEVLPDFKYFFTLSEDLRRLLYSNRLGHRIGIKLNGIIRTINEDMDDTELLRILFYHQKEITRRWGSQKLYNWKKLRHSLNHIVSKNMF
jgi:transposase-like protein